MKRILVTGAGGSPSTNFIRSLRETNEKFYIVGTDSDKYLLMRSEANMNYLLPKVSEQNYLKTLNKIIEKEKIDFLHSQNDLEISFISKHREEIKTKTLLPSKKTVIICQDKFKSYEMWNNKEIRVPKTLLIKSKADLKKAFETFSKEIWLREVSGAGGKGSLPTNNFKRACNWIDLNNGWGKFTASELLTKNSVTWMSIWYNGELIVAQGRKRLYWELSRVSLSGVTGVTGAGVTMSDKSVDEVSLKAIKAIDEKPHGLYGVDLTYDKKNFPNPTEINIGRFFTTHEFFTKAGLNMPYIFVKLAFDEKYKIPKKRINPLKSDLVWIRGVDFLPVLTTANAIEKNTNILKKML